MLVVASTDRTIRKVLSNVSSSRRTPAKPNNVDDTKENANPEENLSRRKEGGFRYGTEPSLDHLGRNNDKEMDPSAKIKQWVCSTNDSVYYTHY